MPLNLTRCPAPVHTDGGTLACVHRRPCPEHTSRLWDLVLLPAALVWAWRPWWPNALGRARDVGHAHTPAVRPCKACHLERVARWAITDDNAHHAHRAASTRRHNAGAYVPGYEPCTCPRGPFTLPPRHGGYKATQPCSRHPKEHTTPPPPPPGPGGGSPSSECPDPAACEANGYAHGQSGLHPLGPRCTAWHQGWTRGHNHAGRTP